MTNRSAGPAPSEPLGPSSSTDEVRADESEPAWQRAVGWDAVASILTSPAARSDPYEDLLGLGGRFGQSLIAADGHEHRRLRAMVAGPFGRTEVPRLVEAEVRPAIEALVSGLEPAGAAELVSELCALIPTPVLAAALSMPESMVERLRPLADILEAGDDDGAATSDALATAEASFHAVHELLAGERAATPRDGLLGELARASDGREASDREIFVLVQLLVVAGFDTLSRAAGILLFALLIEPSRLDALRLDPTLIPAAVEEAMRWDCPAVSVPRRMVEAIDAGTLRLDAGARVHCSLAEANRDPTRWPEPQEFDLHRSHRPHAAFGLGRHTCLGSGLARATLAELVRILLEQLPGLALDPDHPVPEVVGEHVRGPAALHVRWSAGRR